MKGVICGYKPIKEDKFLLDIISYDEVYNHYGSTCIKAFVDKSIFTDDSCIIGTEVKIFSFPPKYYPIIKIISKE